MTSRLWVQIPRLPISRAWVPDHQLCCRIPLWDKKNLQNELLSIKKMSAVKWTWIRIWTFLPSLSASWWIRRLQESAPGLLGVIFNLITNSEIHPCALVREKSPKSAPHRVKCLGTKQQPHGSEHQQVEIYFFLLTNARCREIRRAVLRMHANTYLIHI